MDELRDLIDNNRKLKAYIGFEPSGQFHIGWLIWANKLRDFIDAGIETYLLVATWHAWINDKLEGNIEAIRATGKYILKILDIYGIDQNKIKIRDAEELVSDKDYWALVIKVAKNTTLARMKRSLTIMGRKAEEAEMDVSKLINPAMQVADIIYLDLDIALGGTDQRKAHMLCREIAEKMNRKKVVAIHTPLLTGLKGGTRMEGVDLEDVQLETKMSKSKPEDAIFVHDSPEMVENKIMKAYCPPKQIEMNPVIEIAKYIILPKQGKMKIERPMKYGGDIEINNYLDLEKLYLEGNLHPLDLKKSVSRELNLLLDPIRKKIENSSEIKELMEQISKYRITR